VCGGFCQNGVGQSVKKSFVNIFSDEPACGLEFFGRLSEGILCEEKWIWLFALTFFVTFFRQVYNSFGTLNPEK